jgi:hypothetical protein
MAKQSSFTLKDKLNQLKQSEHKNEESIKDFLKGFAKGDEKDEGQGTEDRTRG